MSSTRQKWTDEERQFLRDHIDSMTNKELACHFNVTIHQIGWILHEMKIKRSAATKSKHRYKYRRRLV